MKRLKTAGYVVGGIVLGYICAMPISWGLDDAPQGIVLLAGMAIGGTVAIWRLRRPAT